MFRIYVFMTSSQQTECAIFLQCSSCHNTVYVNIIISNSSTLSLEVVAAWYQMVHCVTFNPSKSRNVNWLHLVI